MRRRTRTLVALTLSLGLAGTACSGGKKDASPSHVDTVGFLAPAANCDALLKYVREEGAKRVTAYGFGGGQIATTGRFEAVGAAIGGDSSAPGAPGARSGPATSTPHAPQNRVEGGGFSTTNVQEAGIDEPDLVKTDGKRILVVAQGKLHYVDITGAPKRSGSVELTVNDGERNFGMAPTDLLVSGNRVLVFGTTMGFRDGPLPLPAGGPSGARAVDEAMPIGDGALTSTITEVDVSNPSAPKVVQRLRVEGDYVTARQLGTVARVVVRSHPQNLPFVYPENPRSTERAKRFNQDVVRESKLEDWLPMYRLEDASGTELKTGVLTSCERVQLPKQFVGFGAVNVLTFDMANPLTNGDAVSVMAGVETVYASDKHLYVATNTWVDGAVDEQGNFVPPRVADYKTKLHSFDIAGAAPARYVASGEVEGHLLNQFALSEHEGNLRAATTKGAPWSATESSESLLTVLRHAGDKLEPIGKVEGLGKGERIYSVRYVGPTAYVVTFRQTDPFYTVDLSTPTAPKVLGELKIPGYSGYLHPVDKNLVLGIGQDATDEGRVTGAKVSLFDVSNLAVPKELSSHKLGLGNSAAEYDHRAFLWWPDKKMAVLPIQSYGGMVEPARPGVPGAPAPAAPFIGAVVLSVDTSGIKEVGRIEHKPIADASKGQTDCRKVTQDDINRSGAPFTIGPSQLILSCAKGAKGGATGYQCSRIPAEVVRQNTPQGGASMVEEGGFIEMCYDPGAQFNPIERSLVAADRLWTVSQSRLQSNSFADLAVIDAIGW